MSAPELPPDVSAFLDWVGEMARLSGCLDWRERDRIKSDMMKVPERWTASRVPAEALRSKCLAVGLREDETRDVIDWLLRVQAGRQLRPRWIRDYRWPDDPE